MSSDAPADFAIASELLGEAGEGLAWANLGAWAPGLDYPGACRELALAHGRAAQLGPGQQVLDLACGQGASLALWPEAFGVAGVSGLELQAACLARIRQQAPPALVGLYQGRFDQLPLPAGLPAGAFDAVLCVDAAYHARALPAFAGFAAEALKPGGRLVFSTLVQGPGLARAGAAARAGVYWLLARAGIPAASLLAPAALERAVMQQGFAEVVQQDWDAPVLAGFADFVQQRAADLSRAQRWQPAWRKIAATAWLCRLLYTRGYAHYRLISTRRL